LFSTRLSPKLVSVPELPFEKPELVFTTREVAEIPTFAFDTVRPLPPLLLEVEFFISTLTSPTPLMVKPSPPLLSAVAPDTAKSTKAPVPVLAPLIRMPDCPFAFAMT
jgi:hypothetical protein